MRAPAERADQAKQVRNKAEQAEQGQTRRNKAEQRRNTLDRGGTKRVSWRALRKGIFLKMIHTRSYFLIMSVLAHAAFS